jgi:hypothetical protein
MEITLRDGRPDGLRAMPGILDSRVEWPGQVLARRV